MLKVNGNIWIEGKNGAFIGLGRMKLLEGIKEHGSITVAARSMKMSYRQAWELVDSMNKEAHKPLVITAAGGIGGGGTIITNEGNKAIMQFKQLIKQFEKFKKNETEKLK
jgi:molybdate transport system regulatory protein